jgi:hypothetical protein
MRDVAGLAHAPAGAVESVEHPQTAAVEKMAVAQTDNILAASPPACRGGMITTVAAWCRSAGVVGHKGEIGVAGNAFAGTIGWAASTTGASAAGASAHLEGALSALGIKGVVAASACADAVLGGGSGTLRTGAL